MYYNLLPLICTVASFKYYIIIIMFVLWAVVQYIDDNIMSCMVSCRMPNNFHLILFKMNLSWLACLRISRCTNPMHSVNFLCIDILHGMHRIIRSIRNANIDEQTGIN